MSVNPSECTGQQTLDDEVCVGQAINFSGSGSYDNDEAGSPPEITEYKWDFDYDGSTFTCDSTLESPSHSYGTKGTKTVKLKVRDNDGTSPIHWDSTTKTIYVVDITDVDSSHTYAAVDANVTFTATTDPSGHYEPIVWSGGGSPSTQAGEEEFITKWSTAGDKTVLAECCSDSESKDVTIVKVELDFDSLPDSDEESAGGFLAHNDNDDNNNDIADRLDENLSSPEPDLVALLFALSPSLSEGTVKLEALAGSSIIKVWEESTKETEVSLPKTWDLSSESLPDKYYVEGYGTSSSLRDIELKLSYIKNSTTIHSDKVKITIIDVDYEEDGSQTYGYDKYTDTQSETPSFYPKKSVEVGETDTFYADISGNSNIAAEVYFRSTDTDDVTVSPSQASSTNQQVEITGVSEGWAAIPAKLYDPDSYDIIAASMGAYSYNQDSYTVAIRVIHEDDDDDQDIPVGQGKPNETAITAGGNSSLDTTPGGDDTIVGTTITTGADGVCNTTASGDDDQVIPVGQGKANQTCVSAGTNTKRDTIPSGDDGISGENIHTGSDGICDTTADGTDDTSYDPYTAAELQTYLNETIYNQAVVSWSVTKLSDMDVNWDLDLDGELDVGSWTTSEEDVIINNCDPGGYTCVVFLVNDPDHNYAGVSYCPADYGFVFPDISTDEEQTTAHELGHATFQLDDIDDSGPGELAGDHDNLMWHNDTYKGGRLRKGQWQTIQ